MDGRIKQTCWSTEAKSGQLCCFSHPPPFINVYHFFSFYHQEGNPDFFPPLIVISVWILMAATGGRRGGGTTRCPCWQRCIKMVVSHPICRAHLSASKGGSSVPLFFPPLQSSPSLPCLLPLCLSSLLLSRSVIRWGGIRQQHYTDQDANWKHSLYK